MPLSCIIYDLDGTLVDSAPDIALAVNSIRGHYTLDELTEAQVRDFIGDGAEKLVERAIFGMVDDSSQATFNTLPRSIAEVHSLVTEFQDIYEDNPVAQTTVATGAETILSHWQNQGVFQICLTNKPHDIAVQVLERLKLLPYFDLVVGDGARDDDNKILPRKPDVAVLDFVIDQAGSDRNETVLVGDGKPDFDVAKAGKIRCIGLTCGYTASDVVMSKIDQPDMLARSFIEAGEILERLNQSI
ncbi:MAG: phosphoglycolate phosphatase [Planctomycetota bacterium]|jgi:phosphoglycolate phosphatase